MAEVLELRKEDAQNVQGEELHKWLLEYLRTSGVSQATLVKQMGYTHGLMSRFIKENKASLKFLAKLQELKERIESHAGESQNTEDAEPGREIMIRDAAGLPLKRLIETADLLGVLGLCSMCLSDGDIGVLTGPPGSGKTTALHDFANRESSVIYIRADVMMSSRELLEEIGEALGLESMAGSNARKKKMIVKRLKEEPALIIVDEADLLVSKVSVKKLEALRAIWDEAHCGIVLAGMPRLAGYLVKGPGGKENLSQFYSRVRRAYAMRGVSRDEIRRALAEYNMTDQARDYLVAVAMSKARGGLRRFSMLLQNALDMVDQGETITLEIMKEAESMLVSPESLGLGY